MRPKGLDLFARGAQPTAGYCAAEKAEERKMRGLGGRAEKQRARTLLVAPGLTTNKKLLVLWAGRAEP